MEIPYSCAVAGTGAANLTLSNTLAGKALICGSIAYDTIMVFEGRFKQHILPDKIHMLNVSFLVPQMRREFGGCAGNIAYNLRLLGDAGLSDGDGRPGFRALRRVAAQGRRADGSRQGDRQRAHGAGLRDDRPGRQPDLGVSSGRDGQLAPEPRSGRGRRGDRHRRAGRPRRNGAARGTVRGRESAVRVRPGPGLADVRRRGAADFHRTGNLGCGERL